MSVLKTTTGFETVEQYIEAYGFCHWQAQEAIKARDHEAKRVFDLVWELDRTRQLLKMAAKKIAP